MRNMCNTRNVASLRNAGNATRQGMRNKRNTCNVRLPALRRRGLRLVRGSLGSFVIRRR